MQHVTTISVFLLLGCLALRRQGFAACGTDVFVKTQATVRAGGLARGLTKANQQGIDIMPQLPETHYDRKEHGMSAQKLRLVLNIQQIRSDFL